MSLKSILDELCSIARNGIQTENSLFLEQIQKCQKLAKNLETAQKSEEILSKFNLDGQVALVTGGAQGIGRGLAHALGEAGCKVAVADLKLSHAEVVVAELHAKGIQSIAIQVDVAKREQVQGMVTKVLDTWGELHIACNNAGVVSIHAAEDTSEEEWKWITGVDLDGVFYCCQAEAKHMLSRGYGKIINTASMSGRIVNHPQTHVAYNTAKAGVVHMTRTLGAEWAARGVRVNSISPGYIDTAINASPVAESLKPEWYTQTPMGRIGKVEELCGAVVYLASPASDFMTGSDLVIDGGFTCW